MALAGSTIEDSLTGYPVLYNIPYVVMMSISMSGLIYWAKSFPQKDGWLITGISFSTDGGLLIAHGWGPDGFITIFDAVSGAVLSARAYSTSSY